MCPRSTTVALLVSVGEGPAIEIVRQLGIYNGDMRLRVGELTWSTPWDQSLECPLQPVEPRAPDLHCTIVRFTSIRSRLGGGGNLYEGLEPPWPQPVGPDRTVNVQTSAQPSTAHHHDCRGYRHCFLQSFCPRTGISSSPRPCYWASAAAFGCRSPTEDFLYSEEWAGYTRWLPGFELINAFSRHDERKVYVQDKLIEEKEKVAALLEQDTVLYICGSADMARGVRRALIRLFVEIKGWPKEQAEKHIMGEMKKAKQLLEDIWSC